MDANAYLLGHSASEEDRLRRQARELADESRWLLDRIGLAPGARVLDLGCGPCGVLDLMSERVGPNGSVVGLEQSPRTVELARAFVSDGGLTNVEVIEGDGRASGLPRGSFDFVHARLVLVNVREPQDVVREMVELVRPGGVVASHEADYVAHQCDPPCEAWERLFGLYEAHADRNGIDLYVGRRTHGLLRHAGLLDIEIRPLVHAYPYEHPRRDIFLRFVENVRSSLVASGEVEAKELDALVTELRRHLERRDVLVVSHLFFQVWGRRPDNE